MSDRGSGGQVSAATPVNLGWTSSHLGRCESCRTPVTPAVIVRDSGPEDLDATAYLCVPCAAARLCAAPATTREDADAATAARAAAVAEAAVAEAVRFTSQFPQMDGYPVYTEWEAAFTCRAAELGLSPATADAEYGRHLATLAVDGLNEVIRQV